MVAEAVAGGLVEVAVAVGGGADGGVAEVVFRSAALLTQGGRMFRMGDLLDRDGDATGYWHYNTRISSWALAVAEPSPEIQTWEQFAIAHHLKPNDWQLVA